MHVVADDANTIKEGVNDVLLVHGKVQRRCSSENVVLADHGLCVRRPLRPGRPVCMGAALPFMISMKRGGVRQGLGGTCSRGTSICVGRWKGAISEMCGCCSGGEGGYGILLV